MSIRIELAEVSSFCPAIYGMRLPYKSTESIDSVFYEFDPQLHIGSKDTELAKKLIKAGPEHRKFLRMIHCQLEIQAPLFWWKQMDTYKIGTVANSESTMHTISKHEFTFEDFGFDLEERNAPHSEVQEMYYIRLTQIIRTLNAFRKLYLKTKDETTWRCMIELLPSSYLQTRMMDFNYETLRNIYHQRKNHRLSEWKEFCEFLKTLPYSEFITDEWED